MTAKLSDSMQDALVGAVDKQFRNFPTSASLGTLRALAKRGLAHQPNLGSGVLSNSYKLTDEGAAEARRIIAEREAAEQQHRAMLDETMGRFEDTMDALAAAEADEDRLRLVRSAAQQLAHIDTLGEDSWISRHLERHLYQAQRGLPEPRMLFHARQAVRAWQGEPQARWNAPQAAQEPVDGTQESQEPSEAASEAQEAPREVDAKRVRPLEADETRPATMFDPALTYYADGTRVVMRAQDTERTGVTFGMATGAAPYAFQAVRWDDGGSDLVAPHVLHRQEPQEAVEVCTCGATDAYSCLCGDTAQEVASVEEKREVLRGCILSRYEAPEYTAKGKSVSAQGTWGQMMASAQKSLRAGASICPGERGEFTLTSADGGTSVVYAPVLRRPDVEEEPRVGRRFRHARKITTGGQPELCKITRVTRYAVYYRVGIEEDGTGGGKWTSSLEKFPEAVGTWVG